MICGKDLIIKYLDEENETKESIKISSSEEDAPAFDRDAQIGRDSIDLRIGSNGYKIMCDFDYINTLDKDIEKYFYDFTLTGEGIIIYPGETIVVSTVERIKLSGNITGEIIGRTRFARMGLSVSTATKFQGYSNAVVVLQICNHNRVPLKIFPYQKLAQLVIHQVDGIPNEKRGNYFNEQHLKKPMISDDEFSSFDDDRKNAVSRQKSIKIPYMSREGKFNGKKRIERNNMMISVFSRLSASASAVLGIAISIICSIVPSETTLIIVMAVSTVFLSAISVLLDIIKDNNFIDEE